MNITDDPTFKGYSVDVAVIQQDLNPIITKDAHVVELSPVYLSYASFQALFYKDGRKFNPLKYAFNNIFAKPLIGNDYRTVMNSSFENINDISFSLLNTIISAYEEDLHIQTECWDTCTFMNFSTTISKIKSLNDITGECNNNIKCSITLDEFFNNLEAQGLVIDPSSGLPLDPSGNSGILYTGLVAANIIANFHSTTPDVKDVQIKWPFLINFDSYTDPSGGNTVWPKFYWVEDIYGNDTTTPRSDTGLRQSTVYDISGTSGWVSDNLVGFPREAFYLSGVNYATYNRYTAYQYSNIK
jgi:hypothetical protein